MSDYRTTHKERHEVAERLRHLTPSKQIHPDYTPWYTDICGAIGGKKDSWFGISALAERLADLIDPTCSIGYTDLTTDTPDGYDPDGYYYCSRCGELDDYFAEIWDTYQAHGYEGEPPFRYCPHCGARVVIPGE